MTGIPAGGFPTAAAAASSTSDNHTRGLDERWGDPLSTPLIDTGTMHAGVHYFFDSGGNGSQGGVGFSVTFDN